MSVLGRKARRDLVRHRWQYLSVAVTVFLGVALFAASYDAFLNLELSYERTYERLAFADLTVSGGDTAELAARAAVTDGVEAVTTRSVADVPIRVSGDHTLLGRLVELPATGQPEVNQLDVLEGVSPGPDEAAVLVERHMSDHFDLEPGARIEVLGDGDWREIDVAASVASAEYIWPARSRQDLLTSPDDFGVVFAGAPIFAELADDDVVVDQVLVRFAPGADATSLTDRLTTDAIVLGAVNAVPKADQPSNAALQEDVAGFGELSFLFPVLFLGAAAMATFILLSRVVRSQRAQIATLRANGMSSRQVVTHYVEMAMLVTGVAGVTGLLVGAVTGRAVTGFYTDAITVPDTVTGFHPSTLVIGLVLSLLTGALAAAVPARAAARTDPGSALRGVVPSGPGGRSLLERVIPPLRRLPARWRMALRGVGRDRRRSLSTAIGVVLALTLILASWGMVDTVDILLDRQFNEVQRQDAQLYLEPAGPEVLAAVEATPGVERIESVVQTGVAVVGEGGDGERYVTELVAFEPDTEMHDFGSPGLPDDGLLAGRSLAGLLGVGVGDSVTVTPTTGVGSVSTRIAGFVDEPLGTFVYASLDTVATDGAVGPASVMVTFTPDVDRDQMRSTLTTVPGVVAYVDSRSLYETAQSFLSLFYAFVGVMLVFGGLMAFALVFNTATVSAAERSAELAAMKVNGASSGQLARLLAGENLALTALAIVPGLVVGYLVSASFMDSFSSDLFDFGLRMRTRTLALSALAIVVVTCVAQWIVARSLASLDIARVVRERSQ